MWQKRHQIEPDQAGVCILQATLRRALAAKLIDMTTIDMTIDMTTCSTASAITFGFVVLCNVYFLGCRWALFGNRAVGKQARKGHSVY